MNRTREGLETAVRRALALLDDGRAGEARAVLAEALPAAPAHSPLGGALHDDELDHAFAAAETNPAEMLDATAVVRATLEREGLAGFEEPEDAAADAEGHADGEGAFEPVAESPFATPTMVRLLEEQGDVERARVLRDQLSAGSRPASRRERVRATLETWLANIRRGAA